MSRRMRLSLLALAGLLLALLLTLLVTVYLLLRPERFTAMLQAQATEVGLDLSLSSPASPALFPRPALELEGLTLNARGASMPILLAARGRLALPWHTLFGGPTAISRLEIDAPRVDLDALQSWLSSLPAGPAAAPSIPRIDTGIRITRGSLVRGNRLLLDNLDLETGSLLSGRPFTLNLSATDAQDSPTRLQLSATPRIRGDSLQLDELELHLAHEKTLTLQLGGTAHWHGAADAAADLSGRLDDARHGQYDVALTLTPANQRDPLLLALKLEGPGNRVDLRLPPLALADWWSQLDRAEGPQLAVPPGSGHIEAEQAAFGGIRIEGLSIRAGDEAPPSSSSTPAPASPSSPTSRKP
nr:AsmA family protein [Frateuria defendens]